LQRPGGQFPTEIDHVHTNGPWPDREDGLGSRIAGGRFRAEAGHREGRWTMSDRSVSLWQRFQKEDGPDPVQPYPAGQVFRSGALPVSLTRPRTTS
jgi:hypothetical protein